MTLLTISRPSSARAQTATAQVTCWVIADGTELLQTNNENINDTLIKLTGVVAGQTPVATVIGGDGQMQSKDAEAIAIRTNANMVPTDYELYAWDTTLGLFTIDQGDGQTKLAQIPVGPTDAGLKVEGLTFRYDEDGDATNDELWFSYKTDTSGTATQLAGFNMSTRTLVAGPFTITDGGDFDSLVDIAWDSANDTMYGMLTTATDLTKLITINPTSGAFAYAGGSGDSISDIEGLTVAPGYGLYGTTGNDNDSSAYQINTGTGDAVGARLYSFIDSLQLDDTEAIGCVDETPDPTPTPEPSPTPVPPPSPTPVPPPSPTPIPVPTSTPLPVPSSTPVPVPTATSAPAATSTPIPTPTLAIPTSTAVAPVTPIPTPTLAVPTSTAVAPLTPTPTLTPEALDPTPDPTVTPIPTPTPTCTDPDSPDYPCATPTPTPTPTCADPDSPDYPCPTPTPTPTPTCADPDSPDYPCPTPTPTPTPTCADPDSPDYPCPTPTPTPTPTCATPGSPNYPCPTPTPTPTCATPGSPNYPCPTPTPTPTCATPGSPNYPCPTPTPTSAPTCLYGRSGSSPNDPCLPAPAPTCVPVHTGSGGSSGGNYACPTPTPRPVVVIKPTPVPPPKPPGLALTGGESAPLTRLAISIVLAGTVLTLATRFYASKTR